MREGGGGGAPPPNPDYNSLHSWGQWILMAMGASSTRMMTDLTEHFLDSAPTSPSAHDRSLDPDFTVVAS